MRKLGMWRYGSIVLLAALVWGSLPTAYAETSSSPNYQVSEMQLGTGSSLEGCTSQYCARASIGDVSAGTSVGGESKARFGTVTGSDPLLEVIIEPGASNLGELTTERTATKTMVVKIRNYLSNGYVVQIVGNPPQYAGHTLATPATPTASTPGTEQFGINAVANTSPAIGANPVQVPSAQTSFGIVGNGYQTANLFKYVSGDEIAHSNTESGETSYTISMIVNVSNSTPAGNYTADYAAIIVPVY